MEMTSQKGFSWDEAVQIVQRAQDTFNRGDINAILSRYADDIVIRFAGIPEIKGKVAAEKFVRARLAREKNYRVRKTLFMVDGFKIGATFNNSWEDVKTGKKIVGRGVEFWEYRDGKLILWDAALNIWEEGTDTTAMFL
jgi:nuclear transport factor 2 (NTF2) superfamily protein